MGQLPKGSIKLIETKNDAELLKENDFKKPLARGFLKSFSLSSSASFFVSISLIDPFGSCPIANNLRVIFMSN